MMMPYRMNLNQHSDFDSTVRSGIKFKFDKGYLIGVGDPSPIFSIYFSDSVGEIDGDGVQVMLTFTLPVSKEIL